MKVKLDIWHNNHKRLYHEELSEDQVIEAITMYLKSIERIKEDDNVTVSIDEIVSH